MLRIDFGELILTITYATMFAILLGISGLDFKGSVSLGLVLAHFYMVLVNIHKRMRR